MNSQPVLFRTTEQITKSLRAAWVTILHFTLGSFIGILMYRLVDRAQIYFNLFSDVQIIALGMAQLGAVSIILQWNPDISLGLFTAQPLLLVKFFSSKFAPASE